jgi:hypothetical protein
MSCLTSVAASNWMNTYQILLAYRDAAIPAQQSSVNFPDAQSGRIAAAAA